MGIGRAIKGIITGILIGVGAAGPLVEDVDVSDPTQTGSAGRTIPAETEQTTSAPPAKPDTTKKKPE